jgi:methionyl-tRNA formyltransferase
VLKTVFMGTPDFAVAALQAAASRCSILAVVTQPDKPRGRGKNLQPSPVKVWSMEQGIPVLQPERLRKPEAADAIKRLAPDLIITAAFGQILPPAVLDIPPLGCINVHASLLPRHRGASPIQHALLCGDTKTGITIYYMDEGMDTGDIILMRETAIDPKEHAGRLHDRLAALGAELRGL